MRALSYIAVLLVMFNILFALQFYHHRSRPITLTQKAIKPSIHLVNSKLYFEEDSYYRSIGELKEGIEQIDRLRKEIHPRSEDKVAKALAELKDVYDRALDKQVPKDQINRASVNMLLALTFSQVKAAKGFLEKNEEEKCREALRYAMYHVKNALVLSEGTKKDHEIQIYAEMNEIVKNQNMALEKVESTVNRILQELDQSEVSFS